MMDVGGCVEPVKVDAVSLGPLAPEKQMNAISVESAYSVAVNDGNKLGTNDTSTVRVKRTRLQTVCHCCHRFSL